MNGWKMRQVDYAECSGSGSGVGLRYGVPRSRSRQCYGIGEEALRHVFPRAFSSTSESLIGLFYFFIQHF